MDWHLSPVGVFHSNTLSVPTGLGIDQTFVLVGILDIVTIKHPNFIPVGAIVPRSRPAVTHCSHGRHMGNCTSPAANHTSAIKQALVPAPLHAVTI